MKPLLLHHINSGATPGLPSDGRKLCTTQTAAPRQSLPGDGRKLCTTQTAEPRRQRRHAWPAERRSKTLHHADSGTTQTAAPRRQRHHAWPAERRPKIFHNADSSAPVWTAPDWHLPSRTGQRPFPPIRDAPGPMHTARRFSLFAVPPPCPAYPVRGVLPEAAPGQQRPWLATGLYS